MTKILSSIELIRQSHLPLLINLYGDLLIQHHLIHRVARKIPPKNFASTIRRGIINDQNPIIDIILGEKRIYISLIALLLHIVIGWHHNAEWFLFVLTDMVLLFINLELLLQDAWVLLEIEEFLAEGNLLAGYLSPSFPHWVWLEHFELLIGFWQFF